MSYPLPPKCDPNYRIQIFELSKRLQKLPENGVDQYWTTDRRQIQMEEIPIRKWRGRLFVHFPGDQKPTQFKNAFVAAGMIVGWSFSAKRYCPDDRLLPS